MAASRCALDCRLHSRIRPFRLISTSNYVNWWYFFIFAVPSLNSAPTRDPLGFETLLLTAHALSAGGDADLGWRLVKAAEEGNLELVERFLADGVPIDSVTKCVGGEYAQNGASGSNGHTRTRILKTHYLFVHFMLAVSPFICCLYYLNSCACLRQIWYIIAVCSGRCRSRGRRGSFARPLAAANSTQLLFHSRVSLHIAACSIPFHPDIRSSRLL
jgi:hypothetical protein